jgi:hypothetical protein
VESGIINFAGPFSWAWPEAFSAFSWLDTPGTPSVFDAPEVRKTGIYLWTVPLPDGYLIYYVGETGRSFNRRLREHRDELVSARYHVYSAPEFARGEKVMLWPGCWDITERKSDAECKANCSRLSDSIRGMMLVLRLFLAPMSCDKRTRQRIEAAIAQALYGAPGLVGAFQDQGVKYWPRLVNEEPTECTMSAPVRLLGLPDRLEA